MITPSEVCHYSPFGSSGQYDIICPMIPVRVEELRSCLGSALVDKLLLDVNNENSIREYQQGETYAEGEIVIYLGNRYRALTETAEPPSCKCENAWQEVTPFKSKEYNDLWIKHLRSYLAWDIAYSTIGMHTYKMTANGITVTQDNQFGKTTAGTKEIHILKEEYGRVLDTLKESMMEYLKLRSKTCGCYSEVPGCKQACSPSRRTGFSFIS